MNDDDDDDDDNNNIIIIIIIITNYLEVIMFRGTKCLQKIPDNNNTCRSMHCVTN